MKGGFDIMKHILRMIVTIVVLTAVGLCLWFFVFKPTDTETTFTLLKDLTTYKETSGYNSDLAKISSYNNISCYTEATLTERYRLFGAGDATVSIPDSNNPSTTVTASSFYKDYNYGRALGSLDEIYDVYASYTLFAEDVSNKEMKNIKDKANAYKGAIANIVASMKNLIEYEEICKSASSPISDGLKNELENRYTDFSSNYKVAFGAYYDLIISVQEIVKEKTFNGEFVYDAQTSYLDIILMLNSAFFNTANDTVSIIKNTSNSATDLTAEQVALKKACMAIDVYESYESSGWIDISASEFLAAYTAVIQNYSSDLSKVMNAKFNFFAVLGLETDGLGEGSVEGFAPSNISTGAKPYIKTILEFCGIVSE